MTFTLKPSNCPACSSPTKGKILVCETCWWKVPTKDRSTFVRMYARNGNHPEAMRGIGEKIIKGLKAKRAAS